ncbi:hypothetical protein APR04_001661 [Promicromonospora umidemergens]|uniref:DUF1499 domain-containing protein n=1 Tax=Promicromonospora umidemergens TaxID=629679 RepID=A0ABP8Y2J8_9MICO|nr:hypothetical protein [Promicromonospora umidemergens]MCP2282763.1 hypothetical protein [Promicromonospora umidemergens]
MNANARKKLWIGALVVFALVSVVRLVLTVQRDGLGDSTLWIALVIVLVICGITVAVMLRRSSAVVSNARQNRTDVVVVPAYSTGEAADEAASFANAVPGLMSTGGSPMALVVTEALVEVWAGRRSTAPSWTLRRPAEATVVKAVYGTRSVDALHLSDGSASVTVVPAYSPLRAMGGSGKEDLRRAITEVGAGQPSR